MELYREYVKEYDDWRVGRNISSVICIASLATGFLVAGRNNDRD
jgi:hypothetical protein